MLPNYKVFLALVMKIECFPEKLGRTTKIKPRIIIKIIKRRLCAVKKTPRPGKPNDEEIVVKRAERAEIAPGGEERAVRP